MNKTHIIFIILLSMPIALFSQKKEKQKQKAKDSIKVFKKRVLETTEIDILTSLYRQDGDNAAVTGGIGSEELVDFATNINVAIPLNADDVLNVDATISAYSSASSSNLNPFSGASSGDDDDDDDDLRYRDSNTATTGSPWVVASGASQGDVWKNLNLGYSHSSDSRNNIYTTNISFAKEFDYTSLGAGLGFTRLFNQKNTEINFKANIYLDAWNPQYPTEIKTFVAENGNLNADFFEGVAILDKNGNATNKWGNNTWKPINTTLVEDDGRNTYSLSLGLSQILSKRTQFSIFTDLVYQSGWLANPMQRVYFADIDNYYIGNASAIPNYTSRQNKDVFQLADDIERLPDNRFKIPVGLRVSHYVNEYLIIKTYYRFYYDDWGINSHTFKLELPIKISDKITLYPNYRYYNQTAADYFAGYEQHLSTEMFYTSDFDLSAFSSNQLGLGIKYTDIFTKKHIWKLGLKNLSFNYNYYKRDSGLSAHIVSFGTKLISKK